MFFHHCMCYLLFSVSSVLIAAQATSVHDGKKETSGNLDTSQHVSIRYLNEQIQLLRSLLIDQREKASEQEKRIARQEKKMKSLYDKLFKSFDDGGGDVLGFLKAASSSIDDVESRLSDQQEGFLHQQYDTFEKKMTDKLQDILDAREKRSKEESNMFTDEIKAEMMKLISAHETSFHNQTTTDGTESKQMKTTANAQQSEHSDLISSVTREVMDMMQSKIDALEQKMESAAASKSLEKKVNRLQREIGKMEERVQLSHPPRTCHELMNSNPSLESGTYFIDPDGLRSGDPPIRVRCEKSGETVVVHDSMDKIDVGQCSEPGCYSRNVSYGNATLRQMTALTHLSSSCSQSIRYDCLNAPLTFCGTKYAWWNDRNDIKRTYWTGNNSNWTMCPCEEAGSCVDAKVRCNCDASIAAPLSDEGNITNKEHLPVTRLNFGRLLSPSSKGEHTLGPLRCSGASYDEANGSEKLTSCADLWRAGHLVSGLYQVLSMELDGTTLKTLRCDMNKLPDENGHEELIGFSGIVRASLPDWPASITPVIPSSCADLRKAGHITDGLYQIMTKTDQLATVFCKMRNMPALPPIEYDYDEHGGFKAVWNHTKTTESFDETLIGYSSIKTSLHEQYSHVIPSSCADLKRAGHVSSGLYLYQVKSKGGHQGVSTVFCDMRKQWSQTDFETLIGINDVKSSLVHFLVARKSSYAGTKVTIPYQKVMFNMGNAMNITTGLFTAPKTGIYSFTFNFVSSESSNTEAGISLKQFTVGSWNEGSEYKNGASAHVTARLEAGDVVSTYLNSGSLFADEWNQIHFSGSLIHEL